MATCYQQQVSSCSLFVSQMQHTVPCTRVFWSEWCHLWFIVLKMWNKDHSLSLVLYSEKENNILTLMPGCFVSTLHLYRLWVTFLDMWAWKISPLDQANLMFIMTATSFATYTSKSLFLVQLVKHNEPIVDLCFLSAMDDFQLNKWSKHKLAGAESYAYTNSCTYSCELSSASRNIS